jgi:hypothetical protein
MVERMIRLRIGCGEGDGGRGRRRHTGGPGDVPHASVFRPGPS